MGGPLAPVTSPLEGEVDLHRGSGANREGGVHSAVVPILPPSLPLKGGGNALRRAERQA
jgi:hypothetical protein